MKAIIPTGGRGTRMQPLTFSTNKHFIPIANKPLIFYPIESVAEAGIKDVIITYNPGWLEIVQKHLGDGKRWGLNFTYVLQEKPLGLANIIQVCEEHIKGDRFFLHLGDNIFSEGIKELVEYFEKEKPDGLVAKIKHPENWRLGVPIFDKKGRLIDYLEKPSRPPNDYAIPGIYFFDSLIFNCFKGKDEIKPSERGEYEIVEPYKWLIKKGYRVDVLEYKGKWLDPGKFNDWIEANQVLLDKIANGEIKSKVGVGNTVQGRVSIGSGCKIKNSNMRGPSIIGDNATIVNSYVGPYSSISSDCDIQNSSLENSVLMEGVKILNVKQPIDNSLIGSGTEVTDVNGHSNCLELFVGEKSQVRL